MTVLLLPAPTDRGHLSAWTALASASDLTYAQASYVHSGKMARKRSKLDEADACFSAARMVEREQRFRVSEVWKDENDESSDTDPDKEDTR